MAFILSYNAALRVIAAFVIFALGYLAVFAFSILCLLIAAAIYAGARAIGAHRNGVTSPSIDNSTSSDGKAQVRVPALASQPC